MNKLSGSIETSGRLPCSAAEAWDTVCFYEHVATTPSWFLRTVLPIPQQTIGCHGQVGDESRCMYSDGGYLAKRLTRLEGERVDFDIIEQTIRYHRHIKLKGGTIEVIANGTDACKVRMVTHYEFSSSLLNLIRPFVAFTVSAMHRFVMGDMLAKLSAREIEFAVARG